MSEKLDKNKEDKDRLNGFLGDVGDSLAADGNEMLKTRVIKDRNGEIIKDFRGDDRVDKFIAATKQIKLEKGEAVNDFINKMLGILHSNEILGPYNEQVARSLWARENLNTRIETLELKKKSATGTSAEIDEDLKCLNFALVGAESRFNDAFARRGLGEKEPKWQALNAQSKEIQEKLQVVRLKFDKCCEDIKVDMFLAIDNLGRLGGPKAADNLSQMATKEKLKGELSEQLDQLSKQYIDIYEEIKKLEAEQTVKSENYKTGEAVCGNFAAYMAMGLAANGIKNRYVEGYTNSSGDRDQQSGRHAFVWLKQASFIIESTDTHMPCRAILNHPSFLKGDTAITLNSNGDMVTYGTGKGTKINYPEDRLKDIFMYDFNLMANFSSNKTEIVVDAVKNSGAPENEVSACIKDMGKQDKELLNYIRELRKYGEPAALPAQSAQSVGADKSGVKTK